MVKSNRKQFKERSEQPESPLAGLRKLSLILEGHRDTIQSLAFDPKGKTLASGSRDKTIKLWDVATGDLLRHFKGHNDSVHSLAFDATGQILASSSTDRTIRLWDVASGQLINRFGWNDNFSWKVAFDYRGRTLASGCRYSTAGLWVVSSGASPKFLRNEFDIHTTTLDPEGKMLASAGNFGYVQLWDVVKNQLIRLFGGNTDSVESLAFDPKGKTLASGSKDKTIKLWDAQRGELLRSLEGHTSTVIAIDFIANGRLLASRDYKTLRIWDCDTWETLAVSHIQADPTGSLPFVFHPTLPLLASVYFKRDERVLSTSMLINLWELDFNPLESNVSEKVSEAAPSTQAVHHTTAKIVVVGDSGVGKTGLGWRLAHGEFKEHPSTHGQQFWVVDELGKRREDGTECEAILWDLAGQPDYRLTHALFLDDADLALVLFDPTDNRDPLHGVEFWLKQLKAGQASGQDVKQGEKPEFCPTILIGGRADRGEARLTQEELDEFCRQRGISGGYLATSAKEEIGLDELMRRMKAQIPWEQKSATVTTLTFKRIKDYVLGMKENPRLRKMIVSPQDLRKRLEKTDRSWKFTDDEMMTAVGHLANYGYVRVLRTSQGEERVLLVPELLNNLAASFVLEARRNERGLGSLEEKRLLAGEYKFRELEKLSEEEHGILLDAAALLFLKHNVCFRETDLGGASYLVFPELINLKKPLLEDEATEDGVAYTVSGAIENVYASLVVLLGYTQTFTRTNQWRSHARYEVGDGLICGFRQEAEREAELDLVLYFGTNVGRPVRTLFQGLFESFLARRNLSVFRFEPVICSKGHALNRALMREELRDGAASVFCPRCGESLALPKADEPIQLTQVERRKVEEQQWFAARRSRFEQAVFQLASYVDDQKLERPECFISYAWGDNEQERWVERSLATDLQKAGINVVLDRWENERVGASVARFVERIEKCNRVIVVGTPLYLKKYENKDTATGCVVAAEVDVISNRLLGTEKQKETVLPVLLAGDKESSFPPLVYGRVFADFRVEREYFVTAFDLILDLYGIAHKENAVADLRESLRDGEALAQVLFRG
jgi:WD40 repeat protein